MFLAYFARFAEERGFPGVERLTASRVIPVVGEREARRLLRKVDPAGAKGEAERFRRLRNRAVLLLLLDTPGRRSEIAGLRLGDLDLDAGLVRVMGKGSRERWMPVGVAVREALWEYLEARRRVAPPGEEALWLDERGRRMRPAWIYQMLKRLGKRAGVPDLHTHRFRHTYAVQALRSGMPERVLQLIGGWRRIPETYFRTLGLEDAVRFHRSASPADRLARERRGGGRRPASPPRGKL